jgi:hypothetical protein
LCWRSSCARSRGSMRSACQLDHPPAFPRQPIVDFSRACLAHAPHTYPPPSRQVLRQRSVVVTSERDALYNRFQATIYNVQQKSGFKNILLERKLAALGDALEAKEAQLNEVLVRANLDPAVLGQVRGRLDDIIEAKNQTVRDLQGELERVVGAHAELVRAAGVKLAEYGVPAEELGFQPRLETAVAGDMTAGM